MTTDVWQFGPQAAFAGAGRDAVAAHRHVRVLVHATVQEIETRGDARHVTSLRAAVSGGGLLRVVAGRYVLAAGGIENARLLLLSDRVQKAGLGNAHDLVGRFFMEHQYVHAGTVRPRDRGIFERLALYDERRVDGTRILGKLHPTGATVRRESIPNFAAVVFPRHWFHERCRYDAVHSARVLVKGALRGQLPEGGLGHLRSFLSGLDYVAVSAVRAASGRRLLRHFVPGPVFISGAGWSEREEKRRAFSTFEVGLTTEQRPNADNRVMLTGERDEFGARRVHLHWRWRQADRDGVRRACEVLSRELENAGIGRLKIPAGGPQLVYPGLHHHMGTTRMHRDPRHGVVDENGRVHGVDNLFVAGCSVFPTGGYMNPTLTIVALAIRLADHLRAQLAASVPARVGAHASTVA
jgi:choline dehydrogenase-like flavoprotein